MIIAFGLFFLLLIAGMPIAFAVGLAPTIRFLQLGDWDLFTLIPQMLIKGASSFELLAIPFFILTGELMNSTGITQKLVKLANVFVGNIPGGLGHVNVLASVFFAGISGSAVSDVGALGPIEIEIMERGGYRRDYAAALTAASAIIGPIIPPSIIMVIYSYMVGQVSVAALFAAGFIPGFIMGFCLMVINYVESVRFGIHTQSQKYSWKDRWEAFGGSFSALMTPVIILGGILSGVFTPTEAASIAAGYAFFLGLLTQTLRAREIPAIFRRTVITTSTIYLIISASYIFQWVLAFDGFPQQVARFFLEISTNPWLFLLYANILMLIAGMFMEAAVNIILLAPILAPIAYQLGIDPLHFGIIMVVNLSIGLSTPPIGLTLFVASSISKVPLEQIYRQVIPLNLAQIAALFLVTYIPSISMVIPKLLGFA
jgi:TRAP-type transport system large permease protein